MKRFALIALLVAFAAVAGPRSAAEKLAFQREHPCPSTGLRRGACPGWTIDHVKALACGGADHRSNMQYQTTADAREKDRWERKGCPLRRARRD